ncbi:hypothetical protein FZC76_21650 [Sutcliffiella horikoshii]|uniref:Scaffolding protein n=1 Tax=Sutcliffiella horikoshii TaxID=79883 RepID=A0A5D4SDU0_9BACI|nr:hypothetical protein [Sutcliffiella horikoshii]TYS60478.1 hypothetical protein FZC76_21650 [Sutcliffiella horikoshii]
MTFKKVKQPLILDLQFFAEDPPADPPSNDPQDPPADPPKQDPPKEHMIPKSRFDEINNNYKTAKEQLDKLLEEKKEQERLSAEQQGEFEKLYKQASSELETFKNQHSTAETRAKALEGVITNMLEAKLTSIPEEFHDLIPDNLSPEQKLDWIGKAEQKGFFGKEQEQPLGGSTNPPKATGELENLNTFQLLQAGYSTK